MALPKPVSRYDRKSKPGDEFVRRDFASLVTEAINRASK